MVLKITSSKLKTGYRRGYKIKLHNISIHKIQKHLGRINSKCLDFVIFLYFLWEEHFQKNHNESDSL